MKNRYDIAIIGGGAAGLFAAAIAAQKLSSEESGSLRPRIVLLEKMERPGRKILLTGKGRCNLTNRRMWDEFAPHVHPNAEFLKKAFYNFNPADTMEFFEKMGLELVVERGQRVFPKSHRAMDVVDTLVGYIKQSPYIEVVTECEVFSIAASPFKIASSKGEFEAGKVLITTGGLSYPATGSTGAGYLFAKELGHTVTKTLPTLTALKPRLYDRGALEGVSLKNVRVSLNVNNILEQSEFGDLDFTDGGLEGALGFRISRRAVRALEAGQKVKVVLDLKPALSLEKLSQRVEREVVKGNLQFVLRSLLPANLVKYIAKRIDGKEDKAMIIKKLPYILKNVEFEIGGYVGYERCVATQGGVSLKEVVAKSMESRSVKGLYFAGEVLDLDGDTGGYNLQIAFSTAALAIEAALSS